MTKVGVPKEVKNHEYRVGLTPPSVRELISHGHSVFIERGAGEGIGFDDDAYKSLGAVIVPEASDVFHEADLVVKVKEPQPKEFEMLRKDQTLFTFLHLAADPAQTKGLIKSGAIAIAYETVTDDFGGLPLLAPMSAVAGRVSIQAAAAALEKKYGGSGVLLGGIPGVCTGRVAVIGGGVAGYNAARMAVGLGARVAVIDKSHKRLQELDDIFQGRIKTIYSNQANIEEYVEQSDLVVGAVLIPGASAPKLVTRNMIKKMRKGSVVVDIAIDQGGCFETSKPTTHDNPLYEEEGVLHYCVTNMPGAVARTASMALNNATLPYVMQLANCGTEKSLKDNKHLLAGLNVCKGHVTYHAVANVLGYDFVAPEACF